MRCQGAQSRPAAVLFTGEEETRHRSELALACTSRPLVERKLVVAGGCHAASASSSLTLLGWRARQRISPSRSP